jgi:hypothetical protein
MGSALPNLTVAAHSSDVNPSETAHTAKHFRHQTRKKPFPGSECLSLTVKCIVVSLPMTGTKKPARHECDITYVPAFTYCVHHLLLNKVILSRKES